MASPNPPNFILLFYACNNGNLSAFPNAAQIVALISLWIIMLKRKFFLLE